MELICLQIDLARQKERVDYIKDYISFAQKNGYNAVVFYLENAVRTPDTAYFDKEQTYSMDEIRELVAYADAIGVQIIPAFENLGHLEKFFAYPQLARFSEVKEGESGRWFDAPNGSKDCGCPTNPELYKFLDKYVRDVSALFTSKYVHMGLDEPFDFALCERCRQELANGKTREDIFLDRIMHNHALVQSMGKRMMMWDDFFEYADVVTRLPRDIIFCTWNYEFVSDEPYGHWVNRKKRDWFAYYDKLGFDYIFCPYAHGSSASYALDSYTRYAEKHKPFGVLLTQWEKSDKFYLGSYPLVAYAGRRWSGRATQADQINVYEEILGNRECAKLLRSFALPIPSVSFNALALGQNDFAVLHMLHNSLAYGLQQMKEKMATVDNDIFTDAYNYLLQRHLSMRLYILGTKIYDYLESGNCWVVELDKELDEIGAEYDALQIREQTLWEKYRQGIVSTGHAFENKYVDKKAYLQNLKTFIHEKAGASILYVDFGIHEAFGTPRGELRVKYKGEEEKRLYQGSMKPGYVSLDFGGVYTLRFVIENKQVEWITFSAYGEGAMFPMHFRYVQKGEKYVTAKVETLCGKVERADNLLTNDTRFAIMGNDDGKAHFADVDLTKERSEIRLRFAPLA